MTTLITFDVDGTLIESVGQDANKLHKEAFVAAFKQVYGIDTHIDVVQHHGATDPLVLLKVLVEAHGFAKEAVMSKMDAAKDCMIAHYAAHKDRAGDGLQLLPGIHDLLTALHKRPDMQTGLVTGNLEPIGWAKMEALGVKDLFSQPPFGGFGSDVCSGNLAEVWRDRADMIKVAESRAAGDRQVTYHVGDTPFDVKAAKAAGAVPIGVTTGIFSQQQLQDAEPSTVHIASFADVPSALNLFGL